MKKWFWRLLKLCLFLVLVLVVWICGIFVYSHQKLKWSQAKGSESLSFALPQFKAKPSKAWDVVLALHGRFPKNEWFNKIYPLETETNTSASQRSLAWYKDLNKANKALATQKKYLNLFDKALSSKGCPSSIDPRQPGASKKAARVFTIARLTKAAALTALAEIQSGHNDRGTQRLLRILKGLGQQLNDCQHYIARSSVIHASQTTVLRFLGYAFRAPGLSPSLREEVFRELRSLGKPFRERLVKLIQTEAAFKLQQIKTLSLKKARAAFVLHEFSGTWPFWSHAHMHMLFKRALQEHLWLSQQAISVIQNKELGQDRWRKAWEDRDIFSLYAALQYNKSGYLLFRKLKPSLRYESLTWYQSHCVHKVMSLRLHRVAHQAITKQNKTNPLTGKTFDLKQTKHCQLPSPYAESDHLSKGIKLQDLPPLLRPTASAQDNTP